MGFLADIKDMPNQYKYSLKFFDRFYRPENCTIILVGDVKNDKAIEVIKKYYSSWQKGTYHTDVPVEPPQKEEHVVHIPWKNKTSVFIDRISYSSVGDTQNAKRASLDILSQLVFSESSSFVSIAGHQEAACGVRERRSRRSPRSVPLHHYNADQRSEIS